MERNANDTFASQGTGTTGSSASGSSSMGTNAAASAGDKLTDAASTVRDKAGSIKNSLADALETGAEKLRQQASGGAQLAGEAATGGTDVIAEDTRIAQTSNQIAGGLQASADWLREADLDGLKTGIERQVKEHPGRTLAIAVGVGYLLGKAFRK